MSRPRVGSVWHNRGSIYARVTWVDADGKRHDIKRKAMDVTHAQSLCRDMIAEVNNRKRVQPRRAQSYSRKNLLIYFIQLLDGATCPIKIGTTNNVENRVKTLLTHTPYDVKVLATWPGDVKDERSIHAMFSECHIAREWFHCSPQILSYIREKTKQAA